MSKLWCSPLSHSSSLFCPIALIPLNSSPWILWWILLSQWKRTQWVDGWLMWLSVVVVTRLLSLILVRKSNRLSASVHCFCSDCIRLPWPVLCTCDRLPCSLVDATSWRRWWPECRDRWLWWRLWWLKKSFFRSNWTMTLAQRRRT